MSSEQLDLILAVIVSIIFIIAMTVITYIFLKSLLLRAVDKKNTNNAKYLLNDGWEIVTTNQNGIPIFFKKKGKYIFLKETKQIKVSNNAKI